MYVGAKRVDHFLFGRTHGFLGNPPSKPSLRYLNACSLPLKAKIMNPQSPNANPHCVKTKAGAHQSSLNFVHIITI
ncbi:MAG: hypothetical protein ACJA2O_004588, partial [Candidatus Azotimanducaceae bacterium]